MQLETEPWVGKYASSVWKHPSWLGLCLWQHALPFFAPFAPRGPCNPASLPPACPGKAKTAANLTPSTMNMQPSPFKELSQLANSNKRLWTNSATKGFQRIPNVSQYHELRRKLFILWCAIIQGPAFAFLYNIINVTQRLEGWLGGGDGWGRGNSKMPAAAGARCSFCWDCLSQGGPPPPSLITK